MRRSLGKLSRPAIGQTSIKPFLSASPSFNFSSSAGNNGGRGRGRGSDFPKFSFIDSNPTNPKHEPSFQSPLGHGRGKPQSSNPNIPQFSSFGPPNDNRGTVVARGRGTAQSPQFEENPRPVFSPKDREVNLPPNQDQFESQEKNILPSGILSTLSGAGRGKPSQERVYGASEKVDQVNRHIKVKQPVQPQSTTPKMSQEEAVNKARGILSRGGDGVTEGGESGTQGGFRGMRTQGGGSRGRGGGKGRGRGMSYREDDDEEDEEETEVDKANDEKLKKRLGNERMELLVEAFEEASTNVLPSPEEEMHVDLMHTNLLLECEPEYLMAEFDSNPDIDETPPIPLRDALEKMKPFLMAYENIETNKEWENVVEETMKNVPLMKEIVDYYSGPNRVTAKKQGEELERVAKTLPASAPASVKRFTDRAVLSLQSNPGWGFNRKCQFMDKLVWEVSQSYK